MIPSAIIRNLVPAILLAGALSPFRLWACSTCMVGDPTLTLMGTEKPYEGRLRLSADMLTRDETVGRAGFNERVIDETRLALSLAYAPGERVMLGIQIPYVDKRLQNYNLANEEASALGDVTLTLKTFMQPQTRFRHHLYGLLASLRLPTASEQNVDGTAVDIDAQPGIGASVVGAGGWYGYYDFPWLAYASGSYHMMTSEGFQGFRAGDALVTTLGLQYATGFDVAWQLGFESRLSENDRYYGIEDPNSGGFVGFVAPGIIYTFKTDLLLHAAVKIPAIDRLNGDHDEGSVFTLGVTYDF